MTRKATRKAARKRILAKVDIAPDIGGWERGEAAFWIDAASQFRRNSAFLVTDEAKEGRKRIHARKLGFARTAFHNSEAEGAFLP